MTTIEFPEQTTVLAKDQPQYQPLPVHISDDLERVMTSHWQLTWRERFKIFWTGRLWLQQMTFGRKLQPQLPSVDKPDLSA